MKKILSSLMALGMVLAFGTAAFAAEPAKAAEPTKEEKKAPEKVMQATGEVAAVDTKANTITVKSAKKGEVVCDVTADTKISAGKDVKTLADVKVGDKVTVKYAGKSCKSIEIKAAEKKKEKKKGEPKKEGKK